MSFENLLNLNIIKMMHILQLVMDNSVGFFLDGGRGAVGIEPKASY